MVIKSKIRNFQRSEISYRKQMRFYFVQRFLFWISVVFKCGLLCTPSNFLDWDFIKYSLLINYWIIGLEELKVWSIRLSNSPLLFENLHWLGLFTWIEISNCWIRFMNWTSFEILWFIYKFGCAKDLNSITISEVKIVHLNTFTWFFLSIQFEFNINAYPISWWKHA